MIPSAYYNEINPYAAQWLRNLIAAGHIAPGDVDERSIVDVQPDDLIGYTQCHFFAGIGGWSLAARLAGWPDDRPLWTGSCPCQPFSVAGKGEGKEDERHLWPVFFSLIRARTPAVVMGEQVAAAVGKDWLDGVHSDLEGIDYTCGAAVVPACAVDAPHRRDRLWFVADATHQRLNRGGPAGPGRRNEHSNRSGVDVADPHIAERRANRTAWNVDDGQETGWDQGASYAAAGSRWLVGPDGKARRFEPGIRLLAHGVPARVGKLRAYGNAIVPQVAAEVIGAYLDTIDERDCPACGGTGRMGPFFPGGLSTVCGNCTPITATGASALRNMGGGDKPDGRDNVSGQPHGDSHDSAFQPAERTVQEPATDGDRSSEGAGQARRSSGHSRPLLGERARADDQSGDSGFGDPLTAGRDALEKERGDG
ncbi:DNA cytosine methyltransferase [Shinella curvata]|uniref:DNA cytosine methyltransferase n=1 Tax=Shinella curvata TaxID=1817964 RepID=A0ABT8XJ05_9HYPH|nr:DNA cytosine methyltransferase [Shinella curvata]MCJ8053808.1 DNA cytosine methyltransferase [Shinella curvata]MDO6123140.1 DNA cytosine methyltransferase [Shinella curvata]